MTVGEALNNATQTLATAGVDTPKTNAEWLMVHVLGCSRPELALRATDVLSQTEAESWGLLVERRAQRIPLQHLVGTVDFCGLELAVNEHVLVPRPETELLAEAAWSVAAAMDQPKVLDLGTGSGCLAIAVAVYAPESIVDALDVSPGALAVAQANAQRHEVVNRLQFHEVDFRKQWPVLGPMDVIVSNPPYIPTAEIEELPPEVRDHDPRLALDGGKDGLDCYRGLIDAGLAHLRSTGRLFLEIGDEQAGQVGQLIEEAGGRVLEVLPDLNNIERIVVASPAIP